MICFKVYSTNGKHYISHKATLIAVSHNGFAKFLTLAAVSRTWFQFFNASGDINYLLILWLNLIMNSTYIFAGIPTTISLICLPCTAEIANWPNELAPSNFALSEGSETRNLTEAKQGKVKLVSGYELA